MVKLEGLGLPVLQVHFQHVWHEEKRVVFHRLLVNDTKSITKYGTINHPHHTCSVIRINILF